MSQPDRTFWERLEQDPYIRRVRLADAVRAEERTSETVRHLIRSAQGQEKVALEKIARLEPGDMAGLARLQIDLWVARGILDFVENAKEDGDKAAAEIGVQAAPDV